MIPMQASKPLDGTLLQSAVMIVLAAALLLLAVYGLWRLWKGAGRQDMRDAVDRTAPLS